MKKSQDFKISYIIQSVSGFENSMERHLAQGRGITGGMYQRSASVLPGNLIRRLLVLQRNIGHQDCKLGQL